MKIDINSPKLKAVSIGLLIAWVVFVLTMVEDITAEDPRVLFALVGLLAGVLTMVIPQFFRKVQKGEINPKDFNPMFLFLNLAAMTIIWEVVWQTALHVDLTGTYHNIIMRAYATGLLWSAGEEMFWKIIRILSGKE
ncbi:TPA_asm: hypothetical protein vir519_00007 [Caudoviricetes sp. vir519]|nr:TPA_asm: hypothetical protein vir519_00007 [Caudoviricetes sp. vir519]